MYKPSTYLLIAYFPTYLPIGAYNPKHHPVKAIRSLTRSVQVKTNPPGEKKHQNPSTYYNSIITNLKFSTQAKISSFKNPHMKKIDLLLLLLLPRGPKSLKLLYILYNESKHTILALVGKANKSHKCT